ncbi:hypothetical protein ANAPC5_00907 [Anaplasma phagocytophilum]|nr:hypothetical protein ANAPC2_00867 [Anaplasma phagocytophilum]SBO32059.1 hypothetical protein ANAPC4_00680 [Anaplasma phagocytophilum]SBO32216.1 hypothetical protein ANAPC3_00788 [Anaplasma phagocytophilum]SCV64593.1 hypothetical protein ANAPC5_00907 [Anaplasma phagocytophilum]
MADKATGYTKRLVVPVLSQGGNPSDLTRNMLLLHQKLSRHAFTLWRNPRYRRV